MHFNDPKAAIYTALANNAELVAMLAENKRWSSPNSTPSKANSIVPVAQMDGLEPMFITVMGGPTTPTGLMVHDVFIYIRCYNGIDKTYVDIDKALSLIYKTLHRQRLPMANTVNVQTLHETTTDEAVDEGNNMRYRESQYRLVVI
jgi:hypothetical protein